MQRYVLGFAFHDDQVALILKVRPKWQRGRLNGIGGKLEAGEAPRDAMVREFAEETGVQTDAGQWQLFAVLSGEGFEVLCFRAKLDAQRFMAIGTQTDEQVFTLPVDNPAIQKYALSNIPWLLAAARDPDCGRMVLTAQYADNLAKDRLAAMSTA